MLQCRDRNAADKGGFSVPAFSVDAVLASSKSDQSVVLAGGCFWGIQAVFQHVKGVISATSGYSGGSSATAEYERVSTGETGHAESVKITYDPTQITYGRILQIFFSVAHDPTQLNRQGPEEDTQYRSAIFYNGDEQKQIEGDDTNTPVFRALDPGYQALREETVHSDTDRA